MRMLKAKVMDEDSRISTNLAIALAEIQKAWDRSNNNLSKRKLVTSVLSSPPCLVAVSKRQSSTRIDACLRAGQRFW